MPGHSDIRGRIVDISVNQSLSSEPIEPARVMKQIERVEVLGRLLLESK